MSCGSAGQRVVPQFSDKEEVTEHVLVRRACYQLLRPQPAGLL